MNHRNLKKTLIEYCRKLYDRGLLPGIDGNISIRTDDDTVIITPSGIGKDILCPKDLVTMDMSGRVIGGGQPSTEAPMHIAAYQKSPSTGAVIHMHSPYANSFALARQPIDTKYAPFAHFHLGEVGYVEYKTPGFPKFHEAVSACIEEGHIAIVLESHGTMVLGQDMPSAFAKADLLENYAKMLINAKTLGGAYKLSDDQLHDIVSG